MASATKATREGSTQGLVIAVVFRRHQKAPCAVEERDPYPWSQYIRARTRVLVAWSRLLGYMSVGTVASHLLSLH